MTGRATLTMLESSVAMKVMMRTVKRIAHLFGRLGDSVGRVMRPLSTKEAGSHLIAA